MATTVMFEARNHEGIILSDAEIARLKKSEASGIASLDDLMEILQK